MPLAPGRGRGDRRPRERAAVRRERDLELPWAERRRILGDPAAHASAPLAPAHFATIAGARPQPPAPARESPSPASVPRRYAWRRGGRAVPAGAGAEGFAQGRPPAAAGGGGEARVAVGGGWGFSRAARESDTGVLSVVARKF